MYFLKSSSFEKMIDKVWFSLILILLIIAKTQVKYKLLNSPKTLKTKFHVLHRDVLMPGLSENTFVLMDAGLPRKPWPTTGEKCFHIRNLHITFRQYLGKFLVFPKTHF